MKPRRSADNTADGQADRATAMRCWPIAIAALLALGMAFIQAGASAGLLAYRLLADGALALAWLAAMLGIGWPILRRLPVPPLLRLISAAALGIGMVSLVTLGLGLAGWFNGVIAWIIVLGGLGLGGFWLWKERTSRAFAPAKEPSPWNALWLALMPFLGLALAGAAAPPGLLWQDEPAGYDVVEYHLEVPREWYDAGKITGLRHNVFSYMPMNVEMHDLLAMHLRGGPWAGMYLAQFMHLLIMILAVLAAAGVAGALSNKPWAAPLAGAAMGAVPWITSLAPIAYNEGGLMLFGILAIGWALLARDWRGWLLAGTMGGLACGVKLTAVPMVVIAAAMALIARTCFRKSKNAGSHEQPIHLASTLRGLAIFIIAAVVTFSPWLIRNLVWTGNPVFPEAMETLGEGHFSNVQVERWRKAHSPTEKERSLGARLGAAWTRIAIDWRYGYALIPLAIAGGAVNLMARREGSVPRATLAPALGASIAPPPLKRWATPSSNLAALYLLLLLLIQLIIWLAFTHLQGRFYILAIPIGAVLIGSARMERWEWIGAAAVIVIAGIGFAVMNHRYAFLRQWAAQGVLGVEDLKWIIELRTDINVDKLPADKPLVLVGDAQAFFYSQIPMSRLHYKTVFDVPGADGDDWLNKWTKTVPGTINSIKTVPGTVIVFPGELLRFKRTYFSVPTPPESELRDRPAYIIEQPGK